MSEIATNLADAGTSAVAAGTNVASSVTNASAEGTNAASALVDLANAAVCHHCCLFSSNSFTVLLLMAAGVFLGGIGSFCYQRHALPSEKSRDKWELVKILGMGIAAVALVPAFLRTVSSNLIKETETSFEAKLVFVAFCVAATLAAKKFIGAIPEKLLNLTDQALAQGAENQKSIQRVAEVLADRTAKTLQEPPSSGTHTNALEEVPGYDWKELRVIRALLNPRYVIGRTISGLAMDSGLNVATIRGHLAKFQNNGDVAIFTGNPSKGPLWHLTQSGRQKFATLRPDSGSDAVADIGID